ncbi:MAG: TRAP transporter large permease [Burkholderiaceae bacterium]|jgi:tripartite ATP-independent transporter DctM subunit|nr:TRAP transporter large permease [Burkholderiaceae bacterium]
MTWWMILSLLFGALTVLLMTGVPIVFSFLILNIAGALLWFGGLEGIGQVVRNGVAAIANFSLTPIPFFILMGELLLHSGVAMKAIDAFDHVIGRVPGRLAVIAVTAGTVFSAISGSTVATTALLGSLLLPQMLNRGYHPSLATGPIMAIGGVDALIPPSAIAVLMASLSGISISGLLIAGVVPGVLLAALFVAYIVARIVISPELAPAFEPQRIAGWAKWRPVFVNVTPLIAIFVLVVAAMSAGWATPTESAALGALATVAVCVAYRSLTWEHLVLSLKGTASISGMLLFIIFGATTFSQILVFTGATDGIVGLVTGSGLEPWAVLAAMLAILLVLGCFLDQIAILLITLPFYMPLVQLMGYDPIWFGVLYLICMQLGLITPPFGMLLFTMRGVAPASVSTGQIYRAVTPYVCLGLLMLALVAAFPQLATWLPNVLRP